MTKPPFQIVSLSLILAVCFYILLPFEHSMFPQTADGEYYSARLAGFYTALLEGSIPPRWAHTFYSGLGYPVFNFNYPMPNLVGSLFLSFGASIQTAMKLIIIVGYVAGGLGIFWLLQTIFSHPLAPLVGSLMYLTAPYQIHDIFHRATTGEIMMFGLLPYVLLVLPKTARGRFPPALAALVYAVYFLTHNLYTLMFLPLIIAFIVNFYGWAVFRQNFKPILAGLLLSMFFWIPALFEMSYTVLPTARINHDYPTELLSLRQTLKIPGLYLRKNTPPTLDSDQPGLAQLFVLSLAAIVILFYRRIITQKISRFVIISIIFFLTGLFLLNQASLPVWQTFSPIRFMQHPIRLYFIPVFFGSFLGAFLVQFSRWRWVIMAIVIGLTCYNYRFFAFRPVNYVPIEDGHYYRYPLTSAADNEFDPIWYDRLGVEQFLIATHGRVVVASPGAELTAIQSKAFSRSYTVISNQPTTIIEKTLYFPGWETLVDGSRVDLSSSAGRYFGLINYDLPPGRHQVITKFTQNTPQRWVGHSLSFLGLGLLVSLVKRKGKTS